MSKEEDENWEHQIETLEEVKIAFIERLKEKTQDLFSMALQGDLEHGVRWLNEIATERFHVDYPELWDAIVKINSDEFWES